jgi:ubiquinone/menaquinone biosynthesis C-methylase UbiE
MGQEINLLNSYPKVESRLETRTTITIEDQKIASAFDFDYFDGDRRYGYGGYNYDPKYWTKVVSDFISHYSLKQTDAILDIGCAKGFLLADFAIQLPSAKLSGIDISEYAIENCHPLMRGKLTVANAMDLPFDDNSFDLVVSVNTLHNLDYEGCISALSEIQRVSKKFSFVMVDGWKSNKERRDLESWVLTAKTVLSDKEWKRLFLEAGYKGDYYFWVP